MLLNLCDPTSNISKCILVSHVIDENYSLGTSKIGCGDCSKPFLASSVPDLKKDHIKKTLTRILKITCNLTRFPSRLIVFILKSMPMVLRPFGEKESWENRTNKHVFPTPRNFILKNEKRNHNGLQGSYRYHRSLNVWSERRDSNWPCLREK